MKTTTPARLLSALLCAAMLVCLLPGTALAAKEEKTYNGVVASVSCQCSDADGNGHNPTVTISKMTTVSTEPNSITVEVTYDVACSEDPTHNFGPKTTAAELSRQSCTNPMKYEYTDVSGNRELKVLITVPAGAHCWDQGKCTNTGCTATCDHKGSAASPSCKEGAVCSICAMTLDALDHDYTEKTQEPTCTKDGCTLYTCSRCGETTSVKTADKLYHWYDEWKPIGDGSMSAPCKRLGCKHVKIADCFDWRVTLPSEEEAREYSVCPVCGVTDDGTCLELLQPVSVWTRTGSTPRGDLTIRVGDLENGEKLMSLCFEYDSLMMQHTGRAEYTVPAEALEGYRLMLPDEEGNETELEVTVKGGKATFTVDFTAPWQERTPARILHLIPLEQ